MLTTVLSGKARECDLCLTRKLFLNKTAQYISSLTDLFTRPKINKLSNCSAHTDFYVREGYFAAEILFLTKFPHCYNYCQ